MFRGELKNYKRCGLLFQRKATLRADKQWVPPRTSHVVPNAVGQLLRRGTAGKGDPLVESSLGFAPWHTGACGRGSVPTSWCTSREGLLPTPPPQASPTQGRDPVCSQRPHSEDTCCLSSGTKRAYQGLGGHHTPPLNSQQTGKL